MLQNAGVPLVTRRRTTTGPVAVDGRTITLVATTRAVHVGRGARALALHVRARPHHVEVLHHDGRRDVVRIRDVEGTLVTVIALAGAAWLVATRRARAGLGRSAP